MFTSLAACCRRRRAAAPPQPGRSAAATELDPYAAQRRAMQRVQAEELVHLGETDEADEPGPP